MELDPSEFLYYEHIRILNFHKIAQSLVQTVVYSSTYYAITLCVTSMRILKSPCIEIISFYTRSLGNIRPFKKSQACVGVSYFFFLHYQHAACLVVWCVSLTKFCLGNSLKFWAIWTQKIFPRLSKTKQNQTGGLNLRTDLPTAGVSLGRGGRETGITMFLVWGGVIYFNEFFTIPVCVYIF